MASAYSKIDSSTEEKDLKEVHAFATRIGKQPDLLWKESKSAVDRCAVVLRNDKR